MTEQAPERLQRIFTVIDPKRLVQPAFERGEWIASRTGAILKAEEGGSIIGDTAERIIDAPTPISS